MNLDKDLVAEQSGFGISLIGLILALFIGLAVRAVIAPDKVQGHLQKAISHIHPDLEISFQDAYVSFADGIFPDLAVVIRGGVIASDKKCWLAPVMEINEIRLPLSWGHLFRGQIYIHEVHVDIVNLNLRNAPENCETETAKNNLESNSARMPSQFSAPAAGKTAPAVEFKNVRRRNPIDTLHIGTLKINYLPVAFTSAEIKNFKLFLKAQEPRWFEITGQLNLGGESFAGDFSSYANLKIDAIDGDQASLSASAKGLVREGSYDLSIIAKPKEDDFSVALNVEHLPVSQMIPFLKKYRLLSADISGKQAWVSGKATMAGPISKAKQTPIQFQKIKLEGDLGELNLAHAQIQSLEPLKYSPMEFQITNLNIKNFLSFLGKSHPTPTFGNLGNFSGAAVFRSPEDLKLRGDHSGLEFIFSNRGSRQIQNMQMISGELNLQNQKWSINLDRIKPTDGIFEGQILIKADRDFKSVSVDAKLQELSLAPQVQILMTGGGSLGVLGGRIQAQFDRDNLQSLSGQLRWDQILIDGIRIYRPKLQIQTQQNEFILDLAAQELEMQGNHPLTGSLFAPIATPGQLFMARSLTTKIRTQKFQKLSWNGLQMMTGKGPLKSFGGWDQQGQLSGEISMSNAPAKTWKILGSRNQPRLEEKK